MRDARQVDPSTLETPGEAGQALGDYGPGWQQAIAYGVDVTLLERNLTLSPAARIRLADEHASARRAIQSRAVPREVRDALERQHLAEKVAALEALTASE